MQTALYKCTFSYIDYMCYVEKLYTFCVGALLSENRDERFDDMVEFLEGFVNGLFSGEEWKSLNRYIPISINKNCRLTVFKGE